MQKVISYSSRKGGITFSPRRALLRVRHSRASTFARHMAAESPPSSSSSATGTGTGVDATSDFRTQSQPKRTGKRSDVNMEVPAAVMPRMSWEEGPAYWMRPPTRTMYKGLGDGNQMIINSCQPLALSVFTLESDKSSACSSPAQGQGEPARDSDDLLLGLVSHRAHRMTIRLKALHI